MGKMVRAKFSDMMPGEEGFDYFKLGWVFQHPEVSMGIPIPARLIDGKHVPFDGTS